ncbi:hypothetical protein PTTG_06101 [Puccinia triticina 1-1 BBBD Race 1]|uniref:Uncharacterized protein n=1 Tax=Puccinia triticina (isolate 1-1 / race 1 (BBBD)) TaxID=630390 RepID=A0A0C4EZ46_PUCT1|nr:hypothetical protein PTTG_06101 [Puccinia triticina 1-1 BBBD Race 1]
MARAGATLPGRPAQMAGHREEHKLASLRECVPAIPGRVHALTNRLLSGPARIAQGRRQQEGIIHPMLALVSRPEAPGPSRPRAPSRSRAPQRANGAGESQETVILYPARPGGRTALSTTPSKDTLMQQPGKRPARPERPRMNERVRSRPTGGDTARPCGPIRAHQGRECTTRARKRRPEGSNAGARGTDELRSRAHKIKLYITAHTTAPRPPYPCVVGERECGDVGESGAGCGQ